jgi:sugar diacid utilization regulator
MSAYCFAEEARMTPEALVQFAGELARVAASGGGCKAMADLLARHTGSAVLVEDAEWRHLAASGAVPGSARNGRADLTQPIAAGDRNFGQLSIFGNGSTQFEYFARLAAAAMAVELSRERGTQPARRRAFWDRLLSRSYVDAAAARDDAAAHGVTLAQQYVCIALEAESGDEAPSAADQQALRDAAIATFHAGDADAGLVERGATLLMLVPATREIDAANARTAASLLPRTLAKTHPQVRIGGGVGTRATPIELSTSVERALVALTIARRLYGSGRVGVYDDLGVFPLLYSGADAAELRGFAARALAPLRAYDEKHQTELERTLRLYFACGENVKTAAERLCVHRHTVFYRLRQIGEICQCKLDDPYDQLTLRMAIAIDELTA